MSENGRYRIQSVAEMTGVSAATLRAWERRYGIPAPQRTASAYRLYTDHDIELIKRVRELCDGGMAPAQAAQLVLAARDPHLELADLDIDVHDVAIQRIIAAVERFDADQVEAAVQQALFLGSASALFEKVFGPALLQIGQRWHAGTISVGQEHLASEIVGNTLRYLVRLSQPEVPEHTAVLACFADEDHVVPLYGVALRLCEWGFRTVILGARTPPHAIAHAVSETHPTLVGLSLTIVPPAYRSRELLDGYRDACGSTPWLVGGLGAQVLRADIETGGGYVAPTDRQQLRRLVEHVTRRSEPPNS